MSEKEIDRASLPIRRPSFRGATTRTLEGSVPDWSQASHVEPPDGAPNVLLVLIDDAGFGNPSTFGGPIQTPNYTRLAENGLRYNRFHVTALCSPTRAALLTGVIITGSGSAWWASSRARFRDTTRRSRMIARRSRASCRRTVI